MGILGVPSPWMGTPASHRQGWDIQAGTGCLSFPAVGLRICTSRQFGSSTSPSRFFLPSRTFPAVPCEGIPGARASRIDTAVGSGASQWCWVSARSNRWAMVCHRGYCPSATSSPGPVLRVLLRRCPRTVWAGWMPFELSCLGSNARMQVLETVVRICLLEPLDTDPLVGLREALNGGLGASIKRTPGLIENRPFQGI